MATICVFCGSNQGNDPAFAEAATRLGVTIAEQGHRLVYGGGDVGLMGNVADAVLGAGGEVTGVITEQLLELEVGHRNLTRLEVTADMAERKARMADLADGIVVLPGGFGTYDEAFEVLTWNQLGIVARPVVFLDVVTAGQPDGFFAPLFDFLASAGAAGFLSEQHVGLAQRSTDVATAVDLATSEPPPFSKKWVSRK